MSFNNVPINGWPQIKDLEKLNAIASQIENMPTFTSDDRAFLEDLPSYPDTDGTKMLTATTTEGNTSLSYEDIPEELPTFPQSDGEKVLTATTTIGETVLSWESKSSAINYSTTEQATGQKWIDGKDIYCKVVEFETSQTIKYNEWFASNIDATGVVNIVNSAAVAEGAFCPLIGAIDSNKFIFLGCRIDSSFSATGIILFYTKTTL